MKARVVLGATSFTVILMGFAGFSAQSFVAPLRRAAAAEPAKRPPVAAGLPARQAERVITLSKAAQEKGGIVIAPVTEASHTREVRAYGTVLPLQGLAELKKSYASAKAMAENAQAKLKISQKEYARLKALYDQGQNTSLKALQTAEGAWRVDKNDLQAAREELDSLKGAARQQWGEVIASWVFAGSPAFSRLINRKDFLVRVTLPAGQEISPKPRRVMLQLPTGPPLSARLVSPAPQTDPRIQGLSLFYLVSGAPGKLLAGTNVMALVPAGAGIRGFIIPAAAVVWRQGKAVVYLLVSPDRFVARPVATETPLRGGYFVTEGLKTGDRLVVQGAQALLSDESRLPAGQAEED